MKKKVIIAVFIGLLTFNAFSKSGNDTQVIQSDYWIYDALYTVCTEAKASCFIENQPMSIGEMKFYLRSVDYDSLSPAVQKTYDRILSFFNETKDFFPNQDLRFFLGPRVNPEIYYKSNPDIPWSFDYHLHDFAITVPMIIGFSDFVTLETDFFIGKNYIAAKEPDNFHNLPLGGGEMEFLFPRFAYGYTGRTFENWGFNVIAAKEGASIGNTKLGSILYNNTFETEFYTQLNLFTDWFKYTMNVAQVDNTKFWYSHQFNFRPFKCFKLSVIEGSLLNSSFELRYLNPMMIMHSFGSWYSYENQLSEKQYHYYGEGHFCAYLGFTFEYMPVSNLRLYGLYAQNEILDAGGSRSDRSLSVPDSLGGQLGAEYTIPLNNKAVIKTNLEAIYTSPYLYVKQSPDWSLYRERDDMQAVGSVKSWIGSPFGPDCFGAQLYGTYDSNDKYKISLGYLLKLHGENYAETMFQKKVNMGTAENPDWVYVYYPYSQYILAQEADSQKGMDAARDKGRYMWMTGCVEYTNQIAINAQYSVLNNLNVYARTVYSFIFNNKNIFDNFNQGVELSLAVEYKVF